MNHAIGKRPVLAIHPTSRGFAWIVFESPLSPIDWGTTSAGAEHPSRLVSRFERLINRFDPTVLVLEEFDASSGRMRRLCRELAHLASFKGLDVTVLPHSSVQRAFSHALPKSRYEIAEAIARQIDALSPRLPRKRRHYDGEQRGMALFDAAALAITYFAIAGETH